MGGANYMGVFANLTWLYSHHAKFQILQVFTINFLVMHRMSPLRCKQISVRFVEKKNVQINSKEGPLSPVKRINNDCPMIISMKNINDV